MTEREWRDCELREAQLRHRIETVTDQRDAALSNCARLRARLGYWRPRAVRLERSRDLWRHRAVGRRG